MSKNLLIDTDVLIDYLRAQAVSYIESLTNPLLMSAITAAELYAACVKVMNVQNWMHLSVLLKSLPLISLSRLKADYIAGTTRKVIMLGLRMH